jgi:S-disulfanyl-L-cysteine oxidoreductase SoxD
MKSIVFLGCFVLACGGGEAPPPNTADNAAAAHQSTSEAPSEPAAAPATFAEQVTLGQKLYGEQCASCHGDGGEGKTAPPVVGLDKGALPQSPPATAKYRKTEFKTVADIADFVVKNMPPKAPGSLSEEQYFAILAFDLKANGIDLGDKKLDGPLAKTLDIPRK